MLCKNQRIWPFCFHSCPEFLPEFVIVFFCKTKISCHVKTPSIYIVRLSDPFSSDIKNVFLQFRGLLIIKLRQSVVPPPAFIELIIGPFMLIIEPEKTAIRTVCGDIRTFFIILRLFIDPFFIQPLIKRATMIEHAIQNDLHSPVVYFLDKFCKKFIAGFQIFLIYHPLLILGRMGVILVTFCQTLPTIFHDHAKMRIYIIVVLAVVFMVGRRYKDRIQIENFHAQILQVIKLIPDSLEITAIEAPYIHRFRQSFPVLHLMNRLIQIYIFPILYVIGQITVAETIGIDLVHDCTLRPFRRGKSRNQLEGIHILKICSHSQSIIKTSFIVFINFKIITDCTHQRCGPIGVVIK